MKIIKTYPVIFLIAILIRLLIMPFLFHPDVKTQYFQAQFLQHGVLNIYQFIRDNKDALPYKDTFNYPPLTYYLLGSWNFLMSPFLGSHFYQWLNNWGENGYISPYIFRFMFLLKLPYLFLDLGIGILIAKIVEKSNQKKALIIWFFNPITLYIIYGLSNFDIIPTFLTVLSLFYFKKEKYLYSGVSLGLGIATKIYPVLFLPFFIIALLKERKLKDGALFLLTSVGVFLISIIFLWKDFLTISDSGLLTKIFEQKLILGSIKLPYFIIFYTIFCASPLFKKINWQGIAFLIVLTTQLIDSVTQIHPQWLIWGLPFLILFIVKDLKSLFLIIPILVGYFGIVISFEDRFLLLGLLSPILPNIYDVANLEQTIISKIDKSQLLIVSQLLIILGSVSFVVYSKKYWFLNIGHKV